MSSLPDDKNYIYLNLKLKLKIPKTVSDIEIIAFNKVVNAALKHNDKEFYLYKTFTNSAFIGLLLLSGFRKSNDSAETFIFDNKKSALLRHVYKALNAKNAQIAENINVQSNKKKTVRLNNHHSVEVDGDGKEDEKSTFIETNPAHNNKSPYEQQVSSQSAHVPGTYVYNKRNYSNPTNAASQSAHVPGTYVYKTRSTVPRYTFPMLPQINTQPLIQNNMVPVPWPIILRPPPHPSSFRISNLQSNDQKVGSAEPTQYGISAKAMNNSTMIRCVIILRGPRGSGVKQFAFKLEARNPNSVICSGDGRQFIQLVHSNKRLLILGNYNPQISYQSYIAYAVLHGLAFRIVEFYADEALIDVYRSRGNETIPRLCYEIFFKKWQHDPRAEEINYGYQHL